MSSVTDGLQQALANTAFLTAATQAAHWNIVGSDFFQLHKAFNDQYEQLFDLQDVIAERMRALDAPVKMCLTENDALANMQCMSASFSARGMVDTLIAGHTKNTADLKALCALARETGDVVTENLVTEWLYAEDKLVWQLKSWTK